ncbi:TetR/AcrR family transcriptional regulator, partial [Klebsiella pneumoniae]|nr:TetR/AcrR family transcriptional regulator [Klebsiella pneumoniae]
MPRPKLKSDDEVLEAATVVLKRCGPIEFTLSGVAKEVGLSRAALIQRFTNRDGTVAKLAMRQPFVLFKGLTFQKLCLPGAFRPGDHHNK